MEGKRQLRCNVLRTVGLLLAALAYVLSSCTDEGITVPESGYTTIIICPDADNYKVKSIDPQENLVTDVSILIFDEYGCAEHCTWLSVKDLTKEDDGFGTKVKLVSGKKYSFYVCANFGYRVQADRVEELDEIVHHLAYPDEYREGIPMYCEMKDVTVGSDGRVVKLQLRRLMAKISIRMDRSRLSPDVRMIVTDVRIGNTPRKVKVFGESRAQKREDCFPVGFYKEGGQVDALNSRNQDGLSEEVSLYMFENMQGNFASSPLADDSEKVLGEDDPRFWICSFIEIGMDYLSDTQKSGDPKLKYRFYLGEGLNDVNIERNCHYHITVCPQDDGLKGDGWRVDKTGIDYLIQEIGVAPSSVRMTYCLEEVVLSADIKPECASGNLVIWESSNSAVAEVDDRGRLKAVGEGSCMITCSADDGGGAFGECLVECKFLENRFEVHPGKYIRGDIGERIHIWCDYFPPNAPFDIGIDALEFDKERGIYDYVLDEDGKGVTLMLKSSGSGLLYISAGEPINQAEMIVLEVNLPKQSINPEGMGRSLTLCTWRDLPDDLQIQDFRLRHRHPGPVPQPNPPHG